MPISTALSRGYMSKSLMLVQQINFSVPQKSYRWSHYVSKLFSHPTFGKTKKENFWIKIYGWLRMMSCWRFIMTLGQWHNIVVSVAWSPLPVTAAGISATWNGQARPQECSYWHWYLYHADVPPEAHSPFSYSKRCSTFRTIGGDFTATRTTLGRVSLIHDFKTATCVLAFCRSVVVWVQTNLHRKPIWRVCLLHC